MNKEIDPGDFWYINGKTRLWKSYDEWFWKVAKPISNDTCGTRWFKND